MSSANILITGATGATGRNAVQSLLDSKIPVRALVHKVDARSEQLAAQGAEIVEGDLTDFDAVSTALEGITAAYFVYPIQVPGILEATALFAQAASETGVEAIVNMSQVSARRAVKSHASRNHWIAERLFDRSGIPVTHLRPTFFAEWLMYFRRSIRETSSFPLPFGDARYAPITGEDQGRAIAAILKNPVGHGGKSYALYGPVELTQFEIADILSSVMGRKITYVAVDIEPFKDVLKGMGFTPYFIQHIAAVAQDCRDGIFSGTNDLIETLTGKKPMTMEDYITDNRQLFG